MALCASVAVPPVAKQELELLHLHRPPVSQQPRASATALSPAPLAADVAALPSNGVTKIPLESSAHAAPRPENSALLVSSPYSNPENCLDVAALDAPDRLFATALTALKPVAADYVTEPYAASFSFAAVLSLLRDLAAAEHHVWKKRAFYVVVFRSTLNQNADVELLHSLDFESHREACASGGLLKYWFGQRSAERRNLATCFWRSREDACKGGLGPWHKRARSAAAMLYDQITFSTHYFTVLDGATDFRLDS